MIRNLISNLVFWGYGKEEYEYKNNVELRGAINAFKAQIMVATVLSFFVLALDFIGLIMASFMMPWKDFLQATALHIEMAFFVVAVVLTFLGKRYKTACICLCGVYFVATVLLLIYGNEGSLFFCILCAFGYLRAVFSHIHMGYAKKNMDTDEHAEIRSVIKGTNDMRLEVKKVFSDYENGGVNPLNGRINHEAVFDMPLEKEEAEITKCFSKEELDALFCESQPKKAELLFDEVTEITEGNNEH